MVAFYPFSRFWRVLAILACLAACSWDNGSRAVSAVAGRLDLSDYDFRESPPVYLSGQWGYYPGEMLDPALPLPEARELATVPDKWNGDVGPWPESPGMGVATYSLSLQLPKGKTPYGIGFTTVSSAIRFHVNGQELFAAGEVSANPATARAGYAPGVYPLPETAGPLQLLVHISNYEHDRGGFWEAARVGTLQRLEEQAASKVSLTVLMVAAVLTMGLYHLLLWSLRYRDGTALTFALICTLIALRALVVDDVYMQTLFPGISWSWLVRMEYLSLSGMGALGWVFFRQLFPCEVTRPWTMIGVLPCLILAFLSLIAPVQVFTSMLPAFQLWVVYTTAVGPALIAWAAWHKREGAWLYLVCIALLCIFMIHDTLVSEFSSLPLIQLAGGPFSLLPIGVAITLLPQAVILAARTARSSQQLELRTRELSEARDRLDDYARELESRVARRTAELEAANLQLARLARADGLTGLGNRRHFDEQLTELWADHRRRQSPLGLLLVDVDEFKHYNDNYGHQQGDEALRLVARAMQNSINRPRDELARYGGEELAALLPDTDLDGVTVIAERMRVAVEAMQQPHEGARHRFLTVSIGVAVVVPSVSLAAEALVQAADAALYSAKSRGRNQVAAGSLDDPAPASENPVT